MPRRGSLPFLLLVLELAAVEEARGLAEPALPTASRTALAPVRDVRMVAQPLSCESGWVPLLRWFRREEGLPQSSVTGLLVDPSGFLNLTTFGGWVRFDGFRFERQKARSGQTGTAERFTSLVRSPDGAIWLVTQTGQVARWKGGEFDTLLAAPGPALETVGLAVDGAGQPWVRGLDGKLYQWNGRSWFLRGAGQVPRTEPCLMASSSGEIVACGQGQLEWWSPEGQLVANIPIEEEVTDLREGPRGVVWAAIPDGVVRLDRLGRQERWRLDPPAPAPVRRLAWGREQLFLQGVGWVGAVPLDAAGPPVGRLRLDWWHQDPRLRFVRSVTADPSGRFWVGTDGFGLLRVGRPQLTRLCPESLGLPVSAIATGSQGELWVGFWCRGLAKVVGGASQRVRFYRLLVAAESQCVRGLAVDSGGLWVGTDRFLLRFRELRNGLHQADMALDLGGPVRAMLLEEQGDLWVGTQEGWVVRVSPKGEVRERYQAAPGIRRLLRDPQGRIWVVGVGRVGWIESDRVVDAVAPAVVNGSEVRDLVFEGEDVWLVTYGRGLGQLRRGQVVWLDLPDRVRDPHLSAGFRDPVGRAWLLGNRGLTVAKFTTFKQVLQGQRDLAPLVFQIGWAAGFPEGTWAVPNGVLNPEGVLYLPTIEGFVRVDTRGLLKENRPPVFEAFLEDGDGKLLTSPVLSLKQRDAGVRLGLSVANPDSWETQLHQIRLLPASPEWRALEEPSLLLERLPPGQQVVEVRTRGLLGPWVTPQQVATLRVPPRIWEHWFFPWAVGLSVLIAGAFGERFRRRLLERGRAELERERRARAASEERLARLRANLERMGRLAVVGEVSAALTHEVMQPLGALVNTLEALKLRREALSKEGAEEEVKMLEEAMEQVHRASAIVRRYRTFLRPEAKAPMGRIVVAEAIEEALALVQPRLEAHGISLNLDIQPNLPPVFGEPLALEQVIVNLMNNACDALAHWKGVRRVTITARRERNAIRLEVRDTGPGIRRDLLTKLFTPLASDKPEGLGMGLRIAFQNVREMGGEIRIETFGGGAGFVVLLPIETSGTPA